MSPLVEEHRAAFDRDRRMPKPVFDALTECDLLRLWMPESLGGPELSPLDFLEVVEAASELEASVGWIIGNGAGMSRAAGYFPTDVSRAWFADRRSFVVAATGGVGTATRVAGGFRLTGRWPFASGIHHASKIMALCAVAPPAGESEPELISCYLEPSDVTIVDTWQVSGLRGTGSCDFEIRDRFVPGEHVHDFLNFQPAQSGLLYRIPTVSIFATSISAVPLGIAGSAVSTFAKLAGKARPGSKATPGEREVIQDQVGRADAILRAARAGLHEALGELMAAIDGGGQRLIHARVNFRSSVSHAAESAVRIVEMMTSAAGSIAIFEGCGLERCTRDMHAAVKHIAMSPNNYILAGRVRLGLAPGTSRF
ncbi:MULTISPECIES: acyl-CoA dehydrogenase family protein [Bradyrhizobium]|uniref:acyl-CoA dehydrogenase family protein n=1 Tax=Bradyrhizobium TaxID=374 RepID=UPI0015689903|nr:MULTISPECIES: acyl-CoA dehydrogenase family protein [Bradyrhizobium]